MRVDLHNHTTPVLKDSVISRWKMEFRRKDSDYYLQLIKRHRLQKLAITNSHDIEEALSLAHKFPQFIVVGAEYQVMIDGANTQIVVLNVDREIHQELMYRRLRGIANFMALVEKKQLPHFLVHIAWGIPEHHPRAPQIIESLVSNCRAIEIVNIQNSEENAFAFGLARYYQLAGIGGSGHLLTDSGKRAYTEATDAVDIKEFFLAMRQGKVRADICREGDLPGKKPIYLEQMQAMWRSELGWQREALKKWGNNVLSTIVDKLPDYYYLQQKKLYGNKVSSLRKRFVDYLKLKETAKIMNGDKTIEEKKQLWQQEINKIYRCFQE